MSGKNRYLRKNLKIKFSRDYDTPFAIQESKNLLLLYYYTYYTSFQCFSTFFAEYHFRLSKRDNGTLDQQQIWVLIRVGMDAKKETNATVTYRVLF